MLSEAIKYQEKAFGLLWDKGGEIPDEKWIPLYQATYLVDVRIAQAQEYGVERLGEKTLRSVKFEAKANYFALKKALAE